MKILAALVTIVSVVGAWFVFFASDNSTTVTADFSYINGIYPGSPVHVLGVPVGTVDDVSPQGTSVRVTMRVESGVDIPADAGAFVMNPSVISDRFVELGPAYRGGPTLDEAVIPVERNRSPINWDQLLDSVNTVASALGTQSSAGTSGIGSALDIVADGTAGLGPESTMPSATSHEQQLWSAATARNSAPSSRTSTDSSVPSHPVKARFSR